MVFIMSGLNRADGVHQSSDPPTTMNAATFKGPRDAPLLTIPPSIVSSLSSQQEERRSRISRSRGTPFSK